MGSHNDQTVNRRDFLATSTAATAALLTLGNEVRAQGAATAAKPAGPAVNVAVIGLGAHGRELVKRLGKVEGANVAAICDAYEPFLTRTKPSAPRAALVKDYRQILSDKNVHAVVIATPTHKHKDLVLQALQAGKHVYCEAPLAHTVADAKAIALAGKASKQIFQVGLQNRANPQHNHVLKFVRGNAMDKMVSGRGQWHKKTTWRASAGTTEQTNAMNWRLSKATSPGLVGELGIHSIDVASWFFKALPVSVSGYGSIIKHADGRDVPDTVQCVVEYPGGVRFVYDASLANSFDGTYELFMGTDASCLLRGARAWMFKEVDSPLQGWEVYARKENVGDENGIVLVADATQLIALGKKPGEDGTMIEGFKDALFFGMETFVKNIQEKKAPAAGALEGYQATVTALKANEAIVSGSKIAYQKEWFAL